MPTGADDDRLKLREHWLFDPDTAFDNPQKAAHFYQTFTSPAQITAADDLCKLPLEEHWVYAEQHDKQLMEAKAAVENGAAKFPSNLQLCLSISECLILPNGQLLFRGRCWVLNLESLRTRLMQETHNSTLTGHPGRNTMYSIMARNFYWPEISADIRRFVRNCDKCGANQVWRDCRQGLLKPLPIPDRK